jgi:hypothetical protein
MIYGVYIYNINSTIKYGINQWQSSHTYLCSREEGGGRIGDIELI